MDDDLNPLIWDAATKAASRRLLPSQTTPGGQQKQIAPKGGFFNPATLTPDYDEPEFIQFDPPPKTLPEYSTLTTSNGRTLQHIPTIKGSPIWERLPNEPLPYYHAFTCFRDQDNPRVLRQVATLLRGDPEVVQIISDMWHWHLRTQAYDQYAKALQERTRAQKIVFMETEHSSIARNLLTKAQEALANLTAEDLTPALALELIKTGTQLERLANKLPPNAPEPEPKDKQDNQTNLQVNGGQVQVNFVEDWRSN